MAEFSTRKITPAVAVKIPAVNENLANPSGYMEADEFKSWAINGLAAQADVDGIRGSDDAYSSSSTYAVGDYAIYENVLYRCKTAVTTAEDFDSSKWDAVDLKSNREAITSLSNNNLGQVIELASYTSDPYETQTDGYLYIYANGSSNSVTVDFMGHNDGAEYYVWGLGVSDYESKRMYMKKGMRVKVTSNVGSNNRIKYIPLVP